MHVKNRNLTDTGTHRTYKLYSQQMTHTFGIVEDHTGEVVESKDEVHLWLRLQVVLVAAVLLVKLWQHCRICTLQSHGVQWLKHRTLNQDNLGSNPTCHIKSWASFHSKLPQFTQLYEWVLDIASGGMVFILNRFASEESVKRFEQSWGVDTASYKKLPFPQNNNVSVSADNRTGVAYRFVARNQANAILSPKPICCFLGYSCAK